MRRRLLFCVVLLSISFMLFGQPNSYPDTCRVCKTPVPILAQMKKGVVSLQIGKKGKNVLGQDISENLAVELCREMLSNKLSALCGKETYSPSGFINFISMYSSKAMNVLYHPKNSTPAAPSLVNTVPLNDSVYLGLIRTPDGHLLISLLGGRRPKDLLSWNSDSGKYLLNYQALKGDRLLQSNLPALIRLKEKTAGIKYPVFYLSYNAKDTYELIAADSIGNGTPTTDTLSGALGDKLRITGKEVKIRVRGITINVDPIADSAEDAAGVVPGAAVQYEQPPEAKRADPGQAVKDSTPKPPGQGDSLDMNITLLSAANFDFTGKLSTSFLGMLNIFAPNIVPGRPLGFDFGIEKIDYSTTNINGNDSNQVQYFPQNFLLNPLQVNRQLSTIDAGARYLQQYNQYTFTSSNVVWSFYLDPLWQLCRWDAKDEKKGLYAHIHAELLINQWTRTANMKNLYQNPDTLVAGNITSANGFYWVPKNPIVANYNFISSYFGGGLTLYTKLFSEKSLFFCQGTLGWANTTPDFAKLNDQTTLLNPNGTYSESDIVNDRTRFFYQLRLSYIQGLSSKSQLTIGFHVRGNFGDLNCQYAAFVGLNLDLEAIAKLVTGS